MYNITSILEYRNVKGQQLKVKLEGTQYEYFNGRPDWTTITLGDLNMFIAYTYLGSPFQNNDEINEELLESINGSSELFNQYTDNQKQHILKISRTIKNVIVKDQCDSITIDVGKTIVFYICKEKYENWKIFFEKDIQQSDILRIRINKSQTFYYDLKANRLYKSWGKYLENNTLPEGYMFYPMSGIYNEACYLQRKLTPSSNVTKKILNGLDVVGKVSSVTSCALLVGGIFVPVMAPVLLPAAAVAAGSSAWDAGRQINSLVDRGQHNQSLSDAEAGKHWLNLTISTLGVITAPLTAGVKTLELSGSSIIASKFGKPLLMLKNGACITQCSLNIIGITSDVVYSVKKKKLWLKMLSYLQLDLFDVTGKWMSWSTVKNIFDILAKGYQNSRKICQDFNCNIDRLLFFYFMKYVKGDLSFNMENFYKCVWKFLKKQLTYENLMLVWKHLPKYYKKKPMDRMSTSITDGSVANTIDDLERTLCNMDLGLTDINIIENAKTILGGCKMKELLSQIPEQYMDQKMVIFSIQQVVKKANELACQLNDVVQECIMHGKTDCHAINKMFCLEYKIKECCLTEYLLYGIRELRKDVSNLVNEYLVYKSNNYENFRIDCEPFTDKFKMFEMPSPTEVLDKNICMELAQEFDPQEGAYIGYQYKSFENHGFVLYSLKKCVLFDVRKSNDNTTVCICFVE
ncbi:uncharacterized protein LOC126846517 isoform X2 [Adelges cooleyi]|uniref:uncharacterized protein LOC126846517 isoform X2 n=1 Tax=Adelges cooleyi TaxID=133065 RepID=UPI00217F2F23|nr:uncharacterized protein LOC126846517 isoform X2 [Adelges cooleyi]